MQPATPDEPLSTVTESLAFDSPHAVPPNEIDWLELEIKPSLLGRAFRLLYKLPEVTIRVIDNSGHQIDNRLIPSMASAGFIINPSLETASQVLKTSSGTPSGSIRSFAIHIPEEARKFFQPTMTCRISTLPPIPKSNLDDQARRLGEAIELQEAPE